ncbi:cysteine sulfinic acid decarboxylase [Nylanderia fulva]|uniref:cysteine sulfinic acid decarboxylase n=1 Tax=Nylanderia fulva TaxID=613905 RepID=UPI0010FBB725|nr:cysteine sulfinic acid decarboxylase [Nylanderia fulva]
MLSAMAELSINNIATTLENILKILKEEHVFDRSGDHRVVEFLHPKELQSTISLSLDKNATNEKELETLIRQIIRYSVKTSSPHFHNQLYGGLDEYGLAGSWITEALNTSQYTYEVAPVFTMIEHEVITKALELLHYPADSADGIMSPGGSIANMYAMILARYKKVPEVKKLGVSWMDKPLACFTSEDGHYSILKAAHWIGIGTDNVYKVKTDEYGRMDVEDLKKVMTRAENEGRLPFFVNATAGTTVLGAIDPLKEIAEACRNASVWFHVDACLGGSLLVSERYRSQLCGIEFSDSVAWNPHKMLGAPLQCSLFLVKGDKKILYKANCYQADYLFQQDKFYDVSWDTGNKSVQCGRKVDSLKFWLMWKARGTIGLGQLVDQTMHCAKYFLKQIRETPGFRLVQPDFELCTICFWYIPSSMRDKPETANWWQDIYNMTTEIKKRLTLDGSVMIGYTPLMHRECGNFFRMVVTCQPPPTESSMDHVIKEIQKTASDL